MAPETRQLIENQLVTLKETSTGGTVHERLKQISRIFIRHGVTVSDDGRNPIDLTDSRAVAHLVLEHCLSEAAQAAFEGLHSDFMDMTWEALVRNMKEQLQSSFPSSGFFAQLATLPPRYALQGGEGVTQWSAYLEQYFARVAEFIYTQYKVHESEVIRLVVTLQKRRREARLQNKSSFECYALQLDQPTDGHTSARASRLAEYQLALEEAKDSLTDLQGQLSRTDVRRQKLLDREVSVVGRMTELLDSAFQLMEVAEAGGPPIGPQPASRLGVRTRAQTAAEAEASAEDEKQEAGQAVQAPEQT